MLQKSCKRRSQIQKEQEKGFDHKLDYLLDIIHDNALKLVKIAEDREFLLQQRKKARPGDFLEKEKRCELRQQQGKPS